MTDHKVFDCINYETNLTINCLPINGVNYWIRVDRDINDFGYKLCPMNETVNQTLIDNIIYKCISRIYKSEDNCETQDFNVYANQYSYKHIFADGTDVNIIPKYNLNVLYLEKDRRDWFDLV